MGMEREVWILVMAISITMLEGSIGVRYKVGGDSVWSIPLSPDFYSIWSSSFVFYVGDSLEFEFESEFFNVIQVARLDYDSCTTWEAMKILTVSPAIVLLNQEGVFYYICNISNYCQLGQKITIVVHKHPAPTPSPAPAPLPHAPSPAPLPRPRAPGHLDSPVAASPDVLNGDNPSWDSGADRIIRLGFVSFGINFWVGLLIVFW